MDTFLGGAAAWFTIPALVGTVYLLIQVLAGQIGGDLDIDADMDLDTGVGDGAGAEFRMISLQSIAAFAMGGGWVGLTAYRGLDWSLGWSIFAALAAGFGSGWLIVTLLRQMTKLQESGNITIREAIGQRGTVYVMIPPAGQGSGRVTVSVRSRGREFNAVQRGEEVITSNTGVRVVDVDESANALVVEVV